MMWINLIVSLALTFYFVLSWQILISFTFSVLNIIFALVLKSLGQIDSATSYGHLLLSVYTASSVVYAVSLLAYSLVLKEKISESTTVYLSILALAGSFLITYKLLRSS